MHICSGGCCNSAAESLEKGASLVMRALAHSVNVPALNKWTTVAPCMTQVSCMTQFCQVLPEAFTRCFGQGPQAELSDSEEDEGKELGVPLDQTKVWRQLARKRQKKATVFLNDPEAAWLTLLWCVVTLPIMAVHYALFKHGTWYSERHSSGARAAEAGFFCSRTLSPAAAAAGTLADMFLRGPAWPGWGALQGLYGCMTAWPQKRLRTVRRCLLTALGQLFRKLLEPWGRYPWKLFNLTKLQGDAQRAGAKHFWDSRPCCLDGFSLKLRRLLDSEDSVLTDDVLLFLGQVFDRVVPTSTCIERAFARFS